MRNTTKRRVGQFAAIIAAVIVVVAGVPWASVTLGGPGVSPVGTAQAAETTIDDFEDGDKSVAASGWSGWSGDTGSLSVSGTKPIDGSYSGVLFDRRR
ncbi:MAG: hypothetical protein U5J98_06915 [Halobacteriales archaeon]|nr:hypothetical protein [Halobacteriales archaeon]